eukprot:s843_g7.t1
MEMPTASSSGSSAQQLASAVWDFGESTAPPEPPKEAAGDLLSSADPEDVRATAAICGALVAEQGDDVFGLLPRIQACNETPELLGPFLMACEQALPSSSVAEAESCIKREVQSWPPVVLQAARLRSMTYRDMPPAIAKVEASRRTDNWRRAFPDFRHRHARCVATPKQDDLELKEPS